MPTARQFFGQAAVGAKLYCIGGRHKSSEGWSIGSWNECYDTRTDTWITPADKPTESYGFGCVATGGKIYCVGGYTGVQRLNLVEIYDTATDTWSNGAPLPVALLYTACALLDNRIYCIGGEDDDGRTSHLFIYDLQRGAWEAAQNLPESVVRAKAVALNGGVYCIGGEAGNTGASDRLYRYDVAAQGWSRQQDLPQPCCDFGCAQADGTAFLCGGGYDGTDPVFALDLATGDCRVLTELPTPRRRVGASAVDGALFCIGGLRNAEVEDKVEIYTLHPHAPITITCLDQAGAPLRPTQTTSAPVGEAFAVQAPALQGYICTGHSVDAGPRQSGTRVTIDPVEAQGHAIDFYYREAGGQTGGCCGCGRTCVHIHDNSIGQLHVHTCAGCGICTD